MVYSDKCGLLVAVEGIDYSGKSSLCANLADRLDTIAPVVVTSAISDGCTDIGKSLGVIMRAPFSDIDPVAEMHIMTAARLDNYNKIIVPALNEGCIVLSDRYLISMIAYQRGPTGDFLDSVEAYDFLEYVGLGMPADINIFMSIPPNHSRMQFKSDTNRLENRSMEEWDRMHDILYMETVNQPNPLVLRSDIHDEQECAEIAYTHIMEVIDNDDS